MLFVTQVLGRTSCRAAEPFTRRGSSPEMKRATLLLTTSLKKPCVTHGCKWRVTTTRTCSVQTVSLSVTLNAIARSLALTVVRRTTVIATATALGARELTTRILSAHASPAAVTHTRQTQTSCSTRRSTLKCCRACRSC